jgi:S1-C subfamily serine protease
VLERDIDARDEAVPLDRINEILEPVKRLRFVILDACRDNPFVRSMRRTLATRTVRSGYGEIDERSLPPNTLVAYAQRAGATAEDGTGLNSPYTTALLKHLPTPGLDVELALRRVRDDVLMTTRNRQEPFKYGSLGGTELALVAAAQQAQPAPDPKISPASEAERAWSAVKDTKSLTVLKGFVARYKDTIYADLAGARIEDLEKQVAVVQPPKEPVLQPRSKPVYSAAETLERVMPAVVAVQVKRPGTTGNPSVALPRVPKGAAFEEFFEDFFNGKGGRATDQDNEITYASGFIISDEGLIVTSLTRIEPTQEVSVIVDDGANYKAKLVGRDPQTHIVLLKIDSNRKFPSVTFANRSVALGEQVLKASNPFGLQGSASVAKVSGWQTVDELPQSIELNTPIKKGEGGAAIFDLDGEVVGVVYSSRPDEKGTDHPGYAVPANVVAYVVDQLRRSGAVSDEPGLANEFKRTREISSAPNSALLIEVPRASTNNAEASVVFISGYTGSGAERKTSALGSGFVVDGTEGIVVTNNHVVEGADEIVVNFNDGSKLKVDKVLGRDIKTDLAVLKVTPKMPLTNVVFGSASKIRVGDRVMAIGTPFERGGLVTLGIISAKQRDINSGPYDDYLQTDAPINKGNSGGPLFNMNGEVIGVNTAIISPSGGSIGIGFAVPSDTARGEVRRGWLGVKDPNFERRHRRCPWCDGAYRGAYRQRNPRWPGRQGRDSGWRCDPQIRWQGCDLHAWAAAPRGPNADRQGCRLGDPA